MLPSYVVLTFCNGTMQALLGLETVVGEGVSLSGSLGAKFAGALNVASPTLMYLGMYLAWQLYAELRNLPPTQSEDFTSARGTDNATNPQVPGGSQVFRPFSGRAHRLNLSGNPPLFN